MIASINFHPINTCNYFCPFCFEPLDKSNPTSLDAVKVLEFVDASGPVHVGFVGGEPLMWQPLNQVLDALRARGVNTCVVTNGSLLSTLTALPDTLSVGVSNDMAYNQGLVDFLAANPGYVGQVEVTITPTDLSKVETVIQGFRVLGITRFNLSLLAFWDKNAVVEAFIDTEYIEALIEIITTPREGYVVSVFGERNLSCLRMFYAGYYPLDKEFLCVAPLNIYADGHMEWCDLCAHEIDGQNLNTGYSLAVLESQQRGPFGPESSCKFCNLRRYVGDC